MLDFGFYHMDCMDGMKEFPDKFFDLAIVDPPYGLNIGNAPGGATDRSSRSEGSDKFKSAEQLRSEAINVGGGSLLYAQNV